MIYRKQKAWHVNYVLLETAMERRGGPGGCIAQFLVTLVALDPTHVSQWPTVNG